MALPNFCSTAYLGTGRLNKTFSSGKSPGIWATLLGLAHVEPAEENQHEFDDRFTEAAKYTDLPPTYEEVMSGQYPIVSPPAPPVRATTETV